MSARSRRPSHFVPPGPQPRGDDGDGLLQLQVDESLDYLSGNFKIFQKKPGHRWSLDDLMTAFVAAQMVSKFSGPFIDLGCGLGSVLMLLAWKFEQAKGLGIEAQPERAALGRRSLRFNGLEARCKILDGDLRQLESFEALEKVSLITGTPPYFPIGTGVESQQPQASPCRFEVRGGIEEYATAAAQLLTEDGVFVVVTSALEEGRVIKSAAGAGLQVIRHLEVIPKAGKEPLIMVDVMSLTSSQTTERSEVTVRDAQNQWTPEFKNIRMAFGMPISA
jgi:tRNA1Val (adenine37-N6)-methyltransferase